MRKIPVLPTQTGNESFIVPDLRIVYYYDLGYPYYYTIDLANLDMYMGKGYKVKVECINYPELNKREMNWGKDWQTTKSMYRVIDEENTSDIHRQYYRWYLDRNETEFKYHIGMTLQYKILLDNGKEIRSYYINGVVQDRELMY